jgi:hypothetical protein
MESAGPADKRLIVDRQLLKSALGASADCLSPEQLEAFTASDAQVPPHVAQCVRCQAELEMLRAFESNNPLPEEGAAVAWITSHLERQRDQIKNTSVTRIASVTEKTRSSLMTWLFRPGTIRVAIPAFAISMALLVGVVLLRSPKQPDLRADAGNNASVFRSQEVQLVGPIGDIEQLPNRFTWKPYAGAATNKHSLMEIDHDPIWTVKSSDSNLTIPASIRGRMLPGKPFLWQVSALDASGRVLAISQVQKFVAPRGSSSSGESLLPR